MAAESELLEPGDGVHDVALLQLPAYYAALQRGTDRQAAKPCEVGDHGVKTTLSPFVSHGVKLECEYHNTLDLSAPSHI